MFSLLARMLFHDECRLHETICAGGRQRRPHRGRARPGPAADPGVPTEYVAEELRRLIFLRVVSPGERLPNELELAAALATSHVTVSAALRELEDDGLLEIRGVATAAPTSLGAPPLGVAPPLFERSRSEPMRSVTRSSFAACWSPRPQRWWCSDAGPRELSRIPAELTRWWLRASAVPTAPSWPLDTTFHLELARSARNPLIVQSVEHVLRELAPALQALPESDSAQPLGRGAPGHRAGGRRASTARRRELMSTHIRHTERAIEVLLEGLVSAPKQRPTS